MFGGRERDADRRRLPAGRPRRAAAPRPPRRPGLRPGAARADRRHDPRRAGVPGRAPSSPATPRPPIPPEPRRGRAAADRRTAARAPARWARPCAWAATSPAAAPTCCSASSLAIGGGRLIAHRRRPLGRHAAGRTDRQARRDARPPCWSATAEDLARHRPRTARAPIDASPECASSGWPSASRRRTSHHPHPRAVQHQRQLAALELAARPRRRPRAASPAGRRCRRRRRWRSSPGRPRWRSAWRRRRRPRRGPSAAPSAARPRRRRAGCGGARLALDLRARRPRDPSAPRVIASIRSRRRTASRRSPWAPSAGGSSASASVGAWAAISSIASSFRMRPRGWSRCLGGALAPGGDRLEHGQVLGRVLARLQPLPGVFRARRRRGPGRSAPAISSVTQASRPAFSSRARSIGIELGQVGHVGQGVGQLGRRYSGRRAQSVKRLLLSRSIFSIWRTRAS